MTDKATRVKYELTNNAYVSKGTFLGNEGTLLKSVISPGTGVVGVYRVSDDGTLVAVEEVTYVNFTKAKVVAKSILKKYGVNFLDEVRQKKVKTNVN